MEKHAILAGAPLNLLSRRHLRASSIISAAAAALLIGQPLAHAALTVYYVGQNSSGATDTNFDDAPTDTNFNTTDTQPGTTNYADGDDVIFSDKFGGPAGTPLTITVNAPTAGGTAIAPNSVTFEADGGSAATASYQFTDGTATSGIGGAGPVTLASGFEGYVQFNSANTFAGGLAVNGGTLHSATANLPATTTVTLGGGTFQSTSSTSSSTYSATQNFVVTAGTTTSSLQPGATNISLILNGTLTSTAGATPTGTVLNFINNAGGGGQTGALGNISGYTGTIELGNYSGSTLRLDYGSSASSVPLGGSSTAIFDLGAGTATLRSYNGGGSGGSAYTGAIPLGALEGSGTGSSLTGAAHSGSTFYAIGGLGLSTTFAGVVSGTSGIYNVGGNLTLTNANTYTLATSVLGGGLYLNNTSGSGTGTAAVLVANNSPYAFNAAGYGAPTSEGTLGGTGTVSGAVTVNLTATPTTGSTVPNSTVPTSFAQGGHIAPGSAGSSAGSTVGTLSLTGGLALNDYSNLDYTLGSSAITGDDAIATAALTLPSDDISGQDVQVNFTFSGAPELDTAYTLITYSSDTNGSDVADWTATGLPDGDSVSFSDTGSSITATFTSVPEPASLGMLAIGAGSLLVRRRRGPVTRLV